MIRFGSWSTLLALGALFGATIAVLLWFCRRNVEANRFLGALIVVIVLRLVPYILGFAGFYDAYPQLSFAPFDLGLAIGPLLWLYVCRLTLGFVKRGWQWQLLPAACQFLYGLVLLPLPLTFKNSWNDTIHSPWIDPTETVLEAVSLALCLTLAWIRRRNYQTWLNDNVSNREELRLIWLRNVIIALALMLAIWAPYEALVRLAHLDYYQRFPLYVGLTVLVFYLGLEGWRHAAETYPVQVAANALPGESKTEQRDWRADGERWLAQMVTAEWWRDPDLNLERLARLLGTNTTYVSRAFNEGLGMSFNEAVNRQRVAEIQQRLEASDDSDLLTLAFKAGFRSKTSFNRVFKAQTGKTPSQFRVSQGPCVPKSK
jgi:AraC-like DNA-binding protein